jgi:hypothetical protein
LAIGAGGSRRRIKGSIIMDYARGTSVGSANEKIRMGAGRRRTGISTAIIIKPVKITGTLLSCFPPNPMDTSNSESNYHEGPLN